MLKILVVDDDPVIRNMLGRFLTANGFEAHFAEDGLLGLEKAIQVVPELILLDMQMPQIDGLGVFDLLRKNEKTAKIPVLFLTGDNKVGSIDDAMNRGAAGYILKPFDLSRLVDKIRSALDA